jgi:hypothetical protein
MSEGYNHSDFEYDERLLKEVFKKFLKNKTKCQYENDIYIIRLSDEFSLYFELSEDDCDLVLQCVEFESDF